MLAFLKEYVTITRYRDIGELMKRCETLVGGHTTC